MKRTIVATLLVLAAPALLLGQQFQHQSPGQLYGFFGLGWGQQAIYNGPPPVPTIPPSPLPTSHPTIERFGGGGELFLYKGLGAGLDVGYARCGQSDCQNPWVGTGDLSYQFGRNASRGKVDPFVLAGFGGFFPTSAGRGVPVGDFGAGANVWFWRRTALRLEVRSYINPTNGGYPGSYEIEFRVGFTFR
ncbi:MAG: hypothetical protein ACRD2B_08515 [Terriglobia bacterium]